MKSPSRRISRFPSIAAASSPFTSPPIRQGAPSTSKRVIRAMPERPATIAAQVDATSLPHGVTAPSPVRTTRLARAPSGDMLRDQVDGVLHRLDLRQHLVG